MKLTNIDDYVDAVWEQHPELSREEIKRILVYGWKMILQYVSFGNDIHIFSSKIFFFIGRIPVSALSAFNTYCYKLAKRIQYMFKRTKSKWDGYYYFSRTENQYLDYLKQSKKKYKIFENVKLYKLLEECKIKEHSKPYIFRLNEDRTSWTSKFYKEIKTDKAELIIQRDPLKMKDILTSENKFKYIQQ